ncbi:hypothetical protein BDV36DRAFT_273181 [Aspergillus pseudocaelatus]|uniref:Uncharacterized protein n=1 Tax=Aspergillus pseudocaelatus TaxID=1825620 RepID=A0ABQ6W415_9EURO|nr:hypothetical protein BDV36DRAFT_273181 [Aspergillus pseudocaelatus]
MVACNNWFLYQHYDRFTFMCVCCTYAYIFSSPVLFMMSVTVRSGAEETLCFS